ncbi:MAG: hypothetical protein KC656_07470 [Myxococcales bacterium]|nr:hypothetical protein [Myxococcales bacterium]
MLAAFVLLGCKGAPPEEVLDEQLRGVGVNVAGWNVLHDAPPSEVDGTDIGGIPVYRGGLLDAEVVALRIVGPETSWSLEITGDPAFQLLSDQFGFLVGYTCLPDSSGVKDGLLTVTAASQPGREFRVPLRCEGVTDVGFVPVDVQDIDDDTVVGTFDTTAGTVLFDLSTRAETPVRSDACTVAGSGLTDGVFGGVCWDGVFAYDGTVTSLGFGPYVISWLSADGGVALVAESGVLYRKEGDGAPVEVTSGAFLDILWADSEARYAVVTSGTQGWPIRDTFLVDTTTGESTPFTRPDGEPWATGWGPKGLKLSPDRSKLLIPSSYFGDASFALYDVTTGAETSLLDKALGHLAEHATSGDGASISSWDVTPDFRWAAIAFDVIDADPGGFRQVFSAAYVIDIEDGTTWLASVDADGEPIDFAVGGFDGALLERVRIDASGDTVAFGKRYFSRRQAWTELP